MGYYLKKIGVFVAALFIVVAVCSSVFRSLTPWAKQYKSEVEHHLTLLLGQPVTVNTLETGWYWFEPTLQLSQVTIHNGLQPALHINKLLVGINLFKSLWHWQLHPGVLYIDNLKLIFRENAGSWRVDGLSSNEGKDFTPDKAQQLIVWLAAQEKLIIKHLSAEINFERGIVIPITGLNLSIVNNAGFYRIKGEALLDQNHGSAFKLVGGIQFNPYHLENTRGQLYFSAKDFAPTQWQSLLPNIKQRIESGKGDIELWLGLDKGTLSSLQAKLKVEHLSWRPSPKKRVESIQEFSANVAWNLEAGGWHFVADHIHLHTRGYTWPENQISLQYNVDAQSYKVFVKTIILESLLSSPVPWPADLQYILDLNPTGILSNIQAVILDKKIASFLTRFNDLSWHKKDSIPRVINLSGALNWQPNEGRMELDSTNTVIKLPGYALQRFALLNSAVDWSKQQDGLNIKINRLSLEKKDLILKAHGNLEGVTRDSLGKIQLDVDFTAKDLQQWFSLIPRNYLKPKLDYWLKNDIKSIPEITGKVKINGLAKDFPFDNQTGTFSLISHLKGVALFINSQWPLIDDLEGYIKLDSRNFNVDVVRGNLQGAPINQMNLHIADIGKDKEVLLIHGLMEAQGQKMLDFITASPLQEKLSFLKSMVIDSLMSLKLDLEIPLYTGNELLLAKGELKFKDNPVVLKSKAAQLKFDNVSGNLYFTEQGVHNSALTALMAGHPFEIKINTESELPHDTVVSMRGEWDIESLKSQYNSPILDLFKGGFYIDTVLRLVHSTKYLGHLKLNSTLEGMSIDLPKPLGKKKLDKTPTEVALDLYVDNSLRLKANYNNHISSDLYLLPGTDGLMLQSGEVRLGDRFAKDDFKPGLGIRGKLDHFPLQEWNETLSKLTSKSSSGNFAKKLRIIDVTLNHLTLFKQQFDNISIKAKMLPNNNWSLHLNQKNIAGELIYQPAPQATMVSTISGSLSKLYLEKLGAKNDSVIHPMDIPNLDLLINNLSVGNLQIGNVTLKTTSFPGRLVINSCRIETPVYQLNATGEWLQKNKSNQTQVELQLHLIDLAKSLERWDITPVVFASKGDLQLQGGWNDSLFSFTLPSLNANMNLQLRNGVITNLSPETEEKLGLGKLLSILSLQTIPRRLKLDFSDLSQQGFSFDIFKGSFNINKGIMSTQDSYLDGPVAYAEMKGDLNLVKHQYDINLRIAPHIMASLPVVATIAGGPVVGIAAWAANKIINQGMQKIIAYSYKVSGPWEKPVVEQVSIVSKKQEGKL